MYHFIVEVDPRDLHNQSRLDQLYELLNKKDLDSVKDLDSIKDLIKELKEEWGDDSSLQRVTSLLTLVETKNAKKES